MQVLKVSHVGGEVQFHVSFKRWAGAQGCVLVAHGGPGLAEACGICRRDREGEVKCSPKA